MTKMKRLFGVATMVICMMGMLVFASMPASYDTQPAKSVGGQKQEQKTVGGQLQKQDEKAVGGQSVSRQDQPSVSKRWAILIGVSVDGLMYAHEDAALLYRILTDPRGANFKPENIFLLVRSDSKGWNIVDFAQRLSIPIDQVVPPDKEFDPQKHRIALATEVNIEKLFSYLEMNPIIERGDTLLFFFSGHGDAREGVVTLQVEPRSVSQVQTLSTDKTVTPSSQGGFIPLTRIARLMASSRADTQMVILDACRSGEAIGRDVTGLSLRRLFSITRPPEAPNPAYAVFLSCSEGQYSVEDQNYLKQGVFAYFFARALQGAADSDGDGKLTAAELKDYLEQVVPRFTQEYVRGYQTPLVGHTAGGASLLDCPTHFRGLTLQISPPDAKVEVMGRRVVKEASNPEWMKLSVYEDVFGWAPEYRVKVSHRQFGEVVLTIPVGTLGVTTSRIDLNARLRVDGRPVKGYRFVVNCPDIGTVELEAPAKSPLHIVLKGVSVDDPTLVKLSLPDEEIVLGLPEAIPYKSLPIKLREVRVTLPIKQGTAVDGFIRYQVQIGQHWIPKTWEGKIDLATAPAKEVKR